MANDDVTSDDPCARAKALKNCYRRLISGSQESEVEYLQLGIQRRVKYSIANLDALQREIAQAEAECSALDGTPNRNRRFAITAGSRRYR